MLEFELTCRVDSGYSKRKKENEGNHMTSIMCEIEKGMMQMNLHNRKRLIDLENEFMVAGGIYAGKG